MGKPCCGLASALLIRLLGVQNVLLLVAHRDTKDALSRADTANEISSESLSAVQRAFVVVNDVKLIKVGESWTLAPDVVNTGNTPAVDMEMRSSLVNIERVSKDGRGHENLIEDPGDPLFDNHMSYIGGSKITLGPHSSLATSYQYRFRITPYIYRP